MAKAKLDDLAIIIIAAGFSKRFGIQNKLLHHVGGRPLISHLFETVSDLRAGWVTVVTGHDNQAIEALAADYGLRTVHNDAFAEGMGSSIASGVRGLSSQCSGAFVQLGDVAFVDRQVFLDVAGAWREARERGPAIAVPVFEGRRGHPVLFDSSYFRRLSELAGDAGAKSVIVENSAAVTEVQVSDRAVVTDIDTLADAREAAPKSK